MRTRPADIARALVDHAEKEPATLDAACVSALELLKRTSPGFGRRQFLKLVEQEMKRRGDLSSGMLVVPRENSLTSEHVGPLVGKLTGKPVTLQRKIDPDVIGGAVLLVDHKRIDASVQGALRELLQTCLEPLE
jgi:hypothetical protein